MPRKRRPWLRAVPQHTGQPLAAPMPPRDRPSQTTVAKKTRPEQPRTVPPTTQSVLPRAVAVIEGTERYPGVWDGVEPAVGEGSPGCTGWRRGGAKRDRGLHVYREGALRRAEIDDSMYGCRLADSVVVMALRSRVGVAGRQPGAPHRARC